jgi:hypothetical protein
MPELLSRRRALSPAIDAIRSFSRSRSRRISRTLALTFPARAEQYEVFEKLDKRIECEQHAALHSL